MIQGQNNHPVIWNIDNPAGTAAYLGLAKDDEIHVMHSDPIQWTDGNQYTSWKVDAINNAEWVLARTRSRIGVTYKRGEDYYETIAVYKVKVGGYHYGPYSRGEWILSGPTKVKAP